MKFEELLCKFPRVCWLSQKITHISFDVACAHTLVAAEEREGSNFKEARNFFLFPLLPSYLCLRAGLCDTAM